MECFVKGLHSNKSLTKLSLQWCMFDSEATDVFRSFVLTDETRSCIRELCIDGKTFAGTSSGALIASMLINPDETQGTGSSIGSSLQVLELAIVDFASFFNALAAMASRIRLPCLRCSYNVINNAGWKQLIKCLPKLVYLRELHLREVNQLSAPRHFIDALQQNQSLQRVMIAFKHGNSFYEAELCLIQSYCERNKESKLKKVLAKVRVDKGNDDDKTDRSLLPLLFQSAKQVPRTAANSVLIGLLAAGDLIGP